MERFTCRTCLSVADVDESFQIFKQGLNETTIKDVLLQYIPQMETSLSRKDRICSTCLSILTNFIQFVDKCIEIENHLKNGQIVIEDVKYDQSSEDGDEESKDNVQVILDKDLKSYFASDADSSNSSCISVNLSTENIDHDHAYMKAPDVEDKKSLNTKTVNVCQRKLLNNKIKEEKSFNEIGNIKLIPVATVDDEMLGEDFVEACSSQDDNEPSSKITVLATGDEFMDSAIIQIKEESMDSMYEGEGIAYYQSLGNESNIYVCEFCGDGFLSEDLLKEHYPLHGEIRLMCDKCPKVFKNESALKAHYKLKHLEVERFKCDICGQLFGRADYLRNHLKRHEDEKNRENVKCRVPGKFLRFKNTDDPLPCKICGKYYNGIQKLKVHLQTHLVVKRFACEYCDLTYKRWPSLKRHEKTHLESTTAFHRCNVCWKRFYTKEELDFHMSQHGNPRYRCQVCDEQFHRKYLFDNHYLLKHATPEDIENSKKEVIYDTLLELSSQNLLISE